MELYAMIENMKDAMRSMAAGRTYHGCPCGHDMTPNDKCWKCWRSDIQAVVGIVHATWLVAKLLDSLEIERDIYNFVKSQEEKEGGK